MLKDFLFYWFFLDAVFLILSKKHRQERIDYLINLDKKD